MHQVTIPSSSEQLEIAVTTTPDPLSPLTLPCGRTLRNRLVKVALYEHMASLMGGAPNVLHKSLYSQWAMHDWGMIISGNVQISGEHLSLGRDMLMPVPTNHSLPDHEKVLKPWRELAAAMHKDTDGKTLALLQLSHAGRQSPNILGGRKLFAPPLAPSDAPVGASFQHGIISKAIHAFTFQRPRAMEISDIDNVIHSFTASALFASKAGFDGVQLHAAHGYLLAQFASPKTNYRTDEYSYSPENAMRLLHRIVKSIRAVVPSRFILGVKLNAADYVGQAESMTDLSDKEILALRHVHEIATWGGVDFIEVSGGDYEDPQFVSSTPQSSRQAFFARFSQNAVAVLQSSATIVATSEKRNDDSDLESEEGTPNPQSSRQSAVSSLPLVSYVRSPSALPLILLTGGLRTPSALYSALANRHADLLGIGRMSILCPDLPQVLNRLRTKCDCNPDAPNIHSFGANEYGIVGQHGQQEDTEVSSTPSVGDGDPRMDQPFVPEPTPTSSSSTFFIITTWLMGYIHSILPRIEFLGASIAMARYTIYMRRLAMEGTWEEDLHHHPCPASDFIHSDEKAGTVLNFPSALSVDRATPEYISSIMAMLYMWAWAGPPDGGSKGSERNRRLHWYFYSISTAIAIIAIIWLMHYH